MRRCGPAQRYTVTPQAARAWSHKEHFAKSLLIFFSALCLIMAQSLDDITAFLIACKPCIGFHVSQAPRAFGLCMLNGVFKGSFATFLIFVTSWVAVAALAEGLFHNLVYRYHCIASLKYTSVVLLPFYFHCGFLTLIPIIRLQPLKIRPICLTALNRLYPEWRSLLPPTPKRSRAGLILELKMIFLITSVDVPFPFIYTKPP